MGAKCTSLRDLSSNEILVKFCGTAPLTPNDPLWNQLFSFSAPIPQRCDENKLFMEETQVLFDLLVTSNQSTGNFGALMRVFLTRALELKTSAQCDDKIFIWQTTNSLFLIRSVLMHCVQNSRGVEVSLEFLRRSGENPHVTEDLVVQLVEILIDIPLQEDTALLHIESLNALVLLLYIAAYSYTSSKKSQILRCLMTGKGALHAGLLTRTLLQHFCQQHKVEAQWLRRNAAGGSFVLGIASGLWGFISRTSQQDESSNFGVIFASQSLLLLLILANHCTTENWTNPYRQALLSFTDSQDPVQVSPIHPAACFRANYSQLYGTLCDQVEDERATLLLYLLLHQHQQFRNYVYSHADLQRLVLALLQVLYNDKRRGSHHLYMSLIILLLLSEDEGFSSNIHNIVIRNPVWYTERSLPEVSLGGLVILVVIRTVQQNLCNTRDKYLHTNCLATLANMAAHFRRLHLYVCQRLVSLLGHLSKKLSRLSQPTTAVVLDDPGHSAEEREQDIAILEEIIRMLLEILNAALSHQLSSNVQLVYTLLYQREIFDSLRRNANFQDVVANLDTVLNYFATKISALDNPGVAEIMQAIQRGSADFPKDRLKKFPELKFRYVEEEQPEEFFVPYVWSLVQATSNVCWNSIDTLSQVYVENGVHC